MKGGTGNKNRGSIPKTSSPTAKWQAETRRAVLWALFVARLFGQCTDRGKGSEGGICVCAFLGGSLCGVVQLWGRPEGNCPFWSLDSGSCLRPTHFSKKGLPKSMVGFPFAAPPPRTVLGVVGVGKSSWGGAGWVFPDSKVTTGSLQKSHTRSFS